ncbi:MAG: hypothetical protein ACE5E1_02715 [Phycisphaerae bacterium]
MRLNRTVTMAAVTLVGLVALTSLVLAQTRGERADCPGKIICPQTGELICRDACPTVDPDRRDCPGRIICPLTGEWVCTDRCPLGKKTTESAKTPDRPSCCKTADS